MSAPTKEVENSKPKPHPITTNTKAVVAVKIELATNNPTSAGSHESTRPRASQ